MLDAILAQSRNTALIMGLVALIGLLLQKKSAVDTISGTVKTVIGFMVFNIGSNAMSAVVNDFTTLFNTAFGIAGVTTQVELATALALDTYVLKEKKLYSIAIMIIAFLADFVLDVNVIYIIAAGILAGTIRFIWMRKREQTAGAV